MDRSRLERYARLIAEMGVSVQPGQQVIIRTQPEQPAFVRMVAEACYRAGAAQVRVEWEDQALQKLDAEYCTEEVLGQVEPWELERLRGETQSLPCRIYLLSEDPDGLRGVDQAKLSRAAQRKQSIRKPYRDQMENRYQWCIAAVPGAAWAQKLFPDCSHHQAVERLWEAILDASRVTEDPIAAWQAHNENLAARCRHLNALGITALYYTSPAGTDLWVGMIPEAEFKAGRERTLLGHAYNPNIPSEECFISPKRGEAEGVVQATMPLSYQGQLIEDFSIRFQNGRAAAVQAAKNGKLLETLIAMDEGAAYLGECALVPYDSPICRTGLLFYNTLFDENAACHLALGMGFADTIREYQKYTLEQCRAMGVNDSIIHEDFMIGSDTLSIDAETRGGRTVPIFRNGAWAFDI